MGGAKRLLSRGIK